MKGYKALDWDMRATDEYKMQFELGKTYSVDKEITLGIRGFHFCEKIENLNFSYGTVDSRIFEVEAEGDIITYDMKYVARSITLVRELTKTEISSYFKQNMKTLIESTNYNVRRAVAKQGYGLDVLVSDKVAFIRSIVAEQGYGLDKLIDDENWFVRRVVAERGYGLDVLVYDENSKVRCAVAKQGYGLDKLIHDEDSCVRRMVAEQGYGLDILVHDEDWGVRCAVARQSYGLDKLICDESWLVRIVVAQQGYGLDILMKDESLFVRETAEEVYKNANKKIDRTEETEWTTGLRRYIGKNEYPLKPIFGKLRPSKLDNISRKSE